MGPRPRRTQRFSRRFACLQDSSGSIPARSASASSSASDCRSTFRRRVASLKPSASSSSPPLPSVGRLSYADRPLASSPSVKPKRKSAANTSRCRCLGRKSGFAGGCTVGRSGLSAVLLRRPRSKSACSATASTRSNARKNGSEKPPKPEQASRPSTSAASERSSACRPHQAPKPRSPMRDSALQRRAGDPGIEPGVAVLETTVLPIHQSPSRLRIVGARGRAPTASVQRAGLGLGRRRAARSGGAVTG
jgi:hypothetical protein